MFMDSDNFNIFIFNAVCLYYVLINSYFICSMFRCIYFDKHAVMSKSCIDKHFVLSVVCLGAYILINMQ